MNCRVKCGIVKAGEFLAPLVRNLKEIVKRTKNLNHRRIHSQRLVAGSFIMYEMLKDATFDLLLSGVEKRITEVKENYEWKRLFIDSGAFLSDNQDTLKSFENDLYLVFSKDNMKEISRKLRDKRGYEFPQLLHNELYDLMVRYEISMKDAETYIHHLKEMIDVNFRGNIYIVQNGKVLYERENGFADLQNEISNTIETKFASASARKVFVAVGILQ